MSDQPARAVKYETVDIRAFLQDLAGPHHKKIGPAIGCPGGFELDAGRGKVMPRSPQVDTRHAGCDPRQKSCDFRVALICGSRNLQYPVRCAGRKQVVDLTAVTRIILK